MNYIYSCDECGSNQVMDLEGYEKDETGEYVELWCEECGQLNRYELEEE